MAGGRPTKYSAAALKTASEYIVGFESHEHVIPSVIGLAIVLGVSEKTIYNWGEKNKEFLQTLERLKDKQQFVLISKGLTGDFNSNITKLVLGNHGFHDKQDNVHTDAEGKPLAAPVINFIPVCNKK